MAEQRAVCAAVPVRALLQLPLLGVIADIRVYTEVGGLLEVWEPLAPRWAPRSLPSDGTWRPAVPGPNATDIQRSAWLEGSSTKRYVW